MQGDPTVAEGHEIAHRVEHTLLHATPHLEAVPVHLHPVIDGVHQSDLHELSAHHASAEARGA